MITAPKYQNYSGAYQDATVTVCIGNVASGTADSEYPVKVAGKFNSVAPTFADGQRGELQVSAKGELWVGIADPSVGSANYAGVYSPADADGSLNGLVVVARPQAFNGTNWSRQRGDTNGIVVQSGVSSTFWNYAAATGGITNTATAVTIKAAAGAGLRNYLKTLMISHDTLGASTEFAVRDGAAGAVLARIKLQTTATEGTPIIFDPPLRGTANTLMEVVTLTAVTGGVFPNGSGFTGA
jgi:hypothetical protein